MTNEEHNKYIAWVFLGHAAFQIFMLLLTLVFLGFIFAVPQPGRGGPPREFLTFIFGFMFLFQMLFVAPSLVAAYALLKRKPWARIAAIVAGVVSAMNVPIGTAACVYSLWFFLGEHWKSVYRDGDAPSPASGQLVAEHDSRWAGFHTDEKGELIFHPIDPPDWR